MIKNKKKEYVELTFLYFRFRNLFDYGFQRYSFYRNLIAFICNITDYAMIRRVFEEMNKRSIFDEKKEGNKIYYLFNPYNRVIEQNISNTIIWE